MKAIRNEEEAVSPVIGVILMVAIVVILAAVIAAFVFGMAGSTGTTKNVGMTVTVNNSDDPGVDVLWQGGTDINSLTNISATINGEAADSIDGVASDFAVGNVTYIKYSEGVAGTRVIIVGSFTDGSDQVIFDRRY